MQLLFAAGTPFINQEWTLGAGYIVSMTIVADWRVSTGWTTETIESTLGWARATGLRRLQYCSAAVTADFVENSLRAATTRPSMAHLLTIVAPTLQRPSTSFDANVFGLNGRGLTRHLVLPLGCCAL